MAVITISRNDCVSQLSLDMTMGATIISRHDHVRYNYHPVEMTMNVTVDTITYVKISTKVNTSVSG